MRNINDNMYTNKMYQINNKNSQKRARSPFICILNKIIRSFAIKVLSFVKSRAKDEQIDFTKHRIKKILLVRSTFRMGSSILATPAIMLFRKNFPHATIDFVGPSVSRVLFKNMPIDNYYSIARRGSYFLWHNFLILKKIRLADYDLAVDVSCSQSAMGAFIVGFSGTRFRAGLQGKWDTWYNIRIPRPSETNKYRSLPAFLGAMGMETQEIFPRLILTSEEKAEGKRKIETITGGNHVPVVGVFVGGRKIKGKNWPMENFIYLIKGLSIQGIKVVVFFGPEEKKSMECLRHTLGKDVPFVLEPSAMGFASLVSNCTLFISCDSGPMHLACALGIRTIAIFQKADFRRWGPPPEMAKIIYNPEGVSADEVLNVSFKELQHKENKGS